MNTEKATGKGSVFVIYSIVLTALLIVIIALSFKAGQKSDTVILTYADEMLMEPHNLGLPLRGLCFGEEGFRNFFFRSEVNDISDLKGKKIIDLNN